MRVKIRLLASLPERTGGRDSIEVEASTWKDALMRLLEEYPSLKDVITEDGPRPGIILFVDGVDWRIAEDGPAREIVILPVNHGGIEVEIVSWEKVDGASRIVADMIRDSGFKADAIIGIIRGGMVPARLLSDILGVDTIGMIEIKLYEGIGVRGHQPYLRQPLVLDVKDKRVLIVDDISDSGLSLQLATQLISLYSPSEVRTATLYIKPWTKMVPDYYAYETEKWVVFPWERVEYERETQG